MSSFSANRHGRPRPSNISFGRRRSDDKSMPSPSFNSSMSLGHVEDVFCDSSRSVDRLRHHYIAMPSTPSSLSGGSSPAARTERLPSLTDIFHRDILSPPSSGLLPLSSLKGDQAGEVMQRTGSMSSASSDRSRNWNASFCNEGRPASIGPPATPLSPYFAVTGKGPLVSPTATSSERGSSQGTGPSDGDMTPRAVSKPAFESIAHAGVSASSPSCPGAPLIGVQGRGHFETQAWQQQHYQGVASLGSFDTVKRRSSYGTNPVPQLSPESLAKERAEMSKLQASMPRTTGLNGLGIYMDEENIQSPFRKASRAAVGRQSQETSPSGRVSTPIEHTGLTPMVKASKMSDTSTTPTRARAEKSPTSLKALSPVLVNSSQAKISPSARSAKKAHETTKTPLTKSRPMFRLDTGSGKKASKPKGHKMSPDASPWGVFGAKDGWKPLAAPNVSRAIAEANKLVSETAVAANTQPSTLKTPPEGKRQAHSASEAVSPSKRFRATDSHPRLSPYKENMEPSLQTMSPSERARIVTPSYRSASTALPLSTVR